MKSKTMKNAKNIISLVLVCVVLFAAIGGVIAVTSTKTKSVSSFKFSVGAVDANGIHTDSDVSIYTKDLLECQGLTIEPDFEATGSYKVFYYGADKIFLGATEEYDATSGVYKKGEDFPLAKYCRIVITPAVPVDDEGDTVEDFKIRFYEVAGYANDYKITVNKDQSFRYDTEDNLCLADNINIGYSYQSGTESPTEWNLSETTASTGIKILGEPIELSSKIDRVDVFVKSDSAVTGSAYLLIADENGDVISAASIDMSSTAEYTVGEWVRMTIDVSALEGVEFASIAVPGTVDVQLFAYSE